MALTYNATRIYLGTKLGREAKKCSSFQEFEKLWKNTRRKMKNKKTKEAMDGVICMEFYHDAITH